MVFKKIIVLFVTWMFFGISVFSAAPVLNLPKVILPVIPDYQVSIVDFGAIPDGKTLCSDAINKAIEHCSSKGGGTVLIPRGLWLSGPIYLKSKVRLHTEAGTLVSFSTDYSLYPLVETSFEGLDTKRCTSPINGRNLTDIAITGKGIFDGNGEAWRPVKKSKLTQSQWDDFVKSGGVLNDRGDIWYPTPGALKGTLGANMNVPGQNLTAAGLEEIKVFLRPVMVSIVGCKKVLFEDVTFQNSPAWCVHPLLCEDITLRNLTIRNPWFSQNGDGMDIESCKNGLVDNCRLDVGDDAICIKSGKDEDGRKRGVPTENITVRNCVVYHGHGGFTVGSEMSGGVKNILVQGCTFMGTDVGLRFKSNRGRGGVVENIYIEDINMVNIPGEALLFDLYYMISAADKGTSMPVDITTPQFKNIFIRNVVCQGAGRAVLLQGLPEMPLSNVMLTNVLITARTGLLADQVKGLILDDVHIVSETGIPLTIQNTTGVTYNNTPH